MKLPLSKSTYRNIFPKIFPNIVLWSLLLSYLVGLALFATVNAQEPRQYYYGAPTQSQRDSDRRNNAAADTRAWEQQQDQQQYQRQQAEERRRDRDVRESQRRRDFYRDLQR